LSTWLKEDPNLGQLVIVVAYVLTIIIQSMLGNDGFPKGSGDLISSLTNCEPVVARL
jgi:hypothetical protein